MAKVQSKKEAFNLFTQYRSATIQTFRDTAYRMLTHDGLTSVTAREVINQMKVDGTYFDHGNDCWAGVAFKGDPRFVSAGIAYLDGASYNSPNIGPGRRAHGAYHVMRWSLKRP